MNFTNYVVFIVTRCRANLIWIGLLQSPSRVAQLADKVINTKFRFYWQLKQTGYFYPVYVYSRVETNSEP